MKNILDYWPFPYAPRDNQVAALEWLAESDKQFLLLEAPVGAGKSNIGLTYSHYMGDRHHDKRGDSYILTPQRILQQQYEDSVKDIDPIFLSSLYGKGNYSCSRKNSTCDIGDIVKPRCDGCPFQRAKKIAQIAPDTVLNYKLALTSFAFTQTFGKRQLMVMDECHTLEQHLVDFDAFKVLEGRCIKYNVPFKLHKTFASALQWIKDDYLPAIKTAMEKLEDQCEPLFDKAGTDLTRPELRKLRELSNLHDHVDEATEVSLMDLNQLNSHFVLVWDKTMFQFKRLKGEYSFNNIVLPMANKFLFMSSTILNRDGFCEDLGIPQDEADYLSLGSEFDIANRPVYYMPKTRMNAKWKQDENAAGRKRMLEAIQTLCGLHKDETGIIHTGNFEIAKWLVEELDVSQQIYHHNPDSGDDRNSVITAFQGDPKPGLLISPSSTEGLDLKEDLGRFAIFCKVPFGNLGDQWIKRRMEMSSEWYQRKALIDVIQGGGRIVRSNEDWGNVYILDQSWAYLHKSAYHMIPKWWRDSYKMM